MELNALIKPLPCPAGAPQALRLYRVRLDVDWPVDEALLAGLSQDERKRCLRYLRTINQLQFALTRLALRRLLAQETGLAPDALRFELGAHGKPVLSLTGAPVFNVSHSGAYALIAIARGGQVGVDIETVQAMRDVPALAEQTLLPGELELCGHGRDVAAFFQLWTIKEAVLKAWGVGIAQHLSAFEALELTNKELPLRIAAPERWPTTRAWALEAPDGYKATLAWAER
ncbi:4'-phosphopantetheinyl transferase superfamily protein [Chromobacterium sp. S0633]|uniref:4'-phosphopantetheinyl transferase family protein n=1 Tax=Chromobacterium sp. S0633 TaxID=2957805 RepID=UPI0020A10585|nr:4'-phosphopantetheinyl transferase superfamily protein [Chromobacterium sp. S0633]MCP1291898.1 4'-phosphopantetheinyl transferase superfamily protein [Chromobacterium sp. S0633]